MKISDVATSPAVTCRPETTIGQVAREMKERDVGCVVVVDDDDRPVGICTDRDLVVRCMAASWPEQTPIRAAMSEGVAAVPGDADVLRAGELMGTWAYRRLPVVNGEGRVTGVLSLDDLAVLLAAEIDRVVAVVRTERRAHAAR